MNCPKCGFEQEERADCKKCGVVFAKYYAMHTQDSATTPETQEPHHPVGVQPEENRQLAPEISEVRQYVKDLQQRLAEIEFERAERRRIHGEIRGLDERFQESLSLILTRHEDVARQVSELASQPTAPTLNEFAALATKVQALDIESMLQRLDGLEDRIRSFVDDAAGRGSARLMERLGDVEERLDKVEARVTAALDDRGQGAPCSAQAQPDIPPEKLEELRSALQNVTLRYSEIGELKKNHLVLRDALDSLQRDLEELRKEPSANGTGRISDLEKEVLALRAEVRKSYERIESLEAQKRVAPAPDESIQKDLSALREEVAALGRSHAEEKEQSRAEMDALENWIDESLQGLAGIPQKLESCSSQIQRLDQLYQPLTKSVEMLSGATNGSPQKLADLTREVALMHQELAQAQQILMELQGRMDGAMTPGRAEKKAGGPVDMHAIKENLDEIRRFMAAMSRKF